jgi:hypothetical protein
MRIWKPTPSGDGLDPSTSIAGRRHGSEIKHRPRGSRHTFRLEHRTERGLTLVRLHFGACLRVIDRHRPEQLMAHRWGIDSCPKGTPSDSGVHDGSRVVWEPGAGCWFSRRSRRSAARISFKAICREGHAKGSSCGDASFSGQKGERKSVMTSANGSSPSPPICTSLTIQATHPPLVTNRRENTALALAPPNLRRSHLSRCRMAWFGTHRPRPAPYLASIKIPAKKSANAS